MADFGYIKRNLDALNEELDILAARAGVKRPTLVCVTKSGSDEELAELVRAGATDLGENRPGEVKRRGELLREMGFSVNMHEIGTLQRNKVKLIVDGVHTVHSLDSERLARELNRQAELCGRKIPVLVEVNSAKEEQKSGVMPEEAEELILSLAEFPALIPRGLMTMGPAVSNAEELRPYFRSTRALFDRLSGLFAKDTPPILSMGMSDSYAVAIEEGSTIVRIGRKLFKK